MKSQQDVAKRAGVSFMTVSRVINGRGNVRQETREKVLKAIEDLAYHPNAAARALTMNRTNTIGIVVPHDEYYVSATYFTELLFTIERHIQAQGRNLIFSAPPRGKHRGEYAGLYKQRKVDGLIIVAPLLRDLSLRKMAQERIPFVLVNGRVAKGEADLVDVDNFLGTEKAMTHLLSLGHRRIGFISGGLTVINGVHRFRAYLRFLRAHGLDGEPGLIYRGDWSMESGYRALSRFLALKQPPTALFCANDQMALGVIRAAHDIGMRIPRDLSLVGYDDIRMASFSTPALTTVRQPMSRLGECAARLILAAVSGEQREKEQVIIEPELVVRSSTSVPERKESV